MVTIPLCGKGVVTIPDGGAGAWSARAVSGWLLIVNGDVADGLAMVRQVERLGHRSTLTDGASGALRLLETEKYDLVLLEASLMAAGGHEVVAARTPVIVTSVPEASHVVCDWLDGGADDYLPMGACQSRVRTRIAAALASRRARALLAEYQQQVDQLLAAVVAVKQGIPEPGSLASTLDRSDPWAGLARAFLALAAENRELRARAAPTRARLGP